MKIRQCFVSNSSSSSYIIGCKPFVDTKCPMCGASNIDFLTLLECVSRYDNNDDTRLIAEDEKVIDILRDDLRQEQASLREFDGRNPDEIAYPQYSWGKSTVQQEIDRINDHIHKIEDFITKVKKAQENGQKLASISLSYHDTTMNKLFQNAVESGQITILQNY